MRILHRRSLYTYIRDAIKDSILFSHNLYKQLGNQKVGQTIQRIESEPPTSPLMAECVKYNKLFLVEIVAIFFQKRKEMVSSGIEPLIPALLARCLNQLGQETNS